VSPRYFTLAEANALVPRLAEHMGRAVQLHLLVRQLTAQLHARGCRVTQAMLVGREDGELPPGAQRLLLRARALYDAVTEEVAAMEALGAQIKGLEHGIADFPSFLDGATEVSLCWRLGEARITHYHLPEAGFVGRQPVSGRAFASRRGKE
jgi:hypothetical protein